MGILKKIWNDPVGSEVIGGLLVAVILGLVTSHLAGWWPFNRDVPQETLSSSQTTNVASETPNPTLVMPETTKSDSANVKIEEQGKVFIREKSAGELIKHLENLSPLQRESVIDSFYVGRWVKWKGIVSVIRTSFNDTIAVALEDDESLESQVVFLSFNTQWREKIENLRLRDWITYEGKIRKINGQVSLVDASFEMLEPKK